MDNISLYIEVSLGFGLLVVMVFLYLKDTELNKKLRRFENTIENLNFDIYELKKRLEEKEEYIDNKLMESSTKIVSEADINKKIEYKVEKDIQKVMAPLVESLSDFDTTLKGMQESVDQKMSSLNDQVKGVASIPVNATTLDSARVVELYNEGMSSDDIAKNLRTTKGEVDFILNMQHLN
jgi:DNA-binding NarL/FixJ family response regulator